MSKTVLNLTNTLAVVKVVGTDTINLNTDLLLPTEILDSSVTDENPLQGSQPMKVGIIGIQWAATTATTITRDGVELFNLPFSGTIDLSMGRAAVDYTKADKDIVVNNTGGGTCIIYLRKAGGYLSKIEPEYFGQYDDTTKVGK